MQQFTIEQIDLYIQSKRLAWSKTTQKSERARLVANLHLINQGPENLVKVAHLKPYSLKTLFLRAGELADYCKHTPNLYKDYLKTNALHFKHAYERVNVQLSYQEASAQVAKIADPAAKKVAQAILASGLRAHEALRYDGSGEIMGKGSKKRPVFIEENLLSEGLTYDKLYRELKAVGLKPHDLRKLAATRLVEAGLREADLMTVFGWSSIQTASYYLQAKNKNELKALVNSALKTKE